MVKPMAVNKKHDEFHTLDMNVGWETPLGYPKGIEQKILSGGLDETNKRGTLRGSCTSHPACSRRSPSCTNTGRKFSSCRASSASATTAREPAENHFRRTPTPCVRPALITDRSSQAVGAFFWKCITSIRSERRPRGAGHA